MSTVLSAVGFRLAVERKSGELSENNIVSSKIVLYTYTAQVKKPTPQYALAADTEDPPRKPRTVLRTADDKEVGILEFRHSDSTLVFRVEADIPLRKLQKAEIRTQDGQIFTGEVSVEGRNLLVLLRKKKVFPKDVSKITFTMAE